MFTIDLYKGQSLPVRTKPQGLALIIATYAVPAVVAVLLGSFYLRNRIVIAVEKQKAATFQSQTERLGDALKLKESYEKDKTSVNNCLADVSASIGRHIQWSPILLTVVENLPDSVVLTGLEVKRSSVKRKVAVKNDPGKKVDSNVPVRTLKMRVSGNPQYNCDQEVKAFRDRLRASKTLGPKLEDIVIASQGHDTLEGKDVVSYDIDCIFKPGI